jgi:thiosulfate dehydrogenase
MKKVFFAPVLLVFAFACSPSPHKNIEPEKRTSVTKELFTAPDTSELKDDEWGTMVKYGRQLVQHTAYYIGPDGVVSKNLGNKMNCTNCHLNNGTKPYGFNFFDSHRTYPQYRAREDQILTMSDRVNNCIERPHNGKPLKLDSKEMVAIVSYIKWIGEKYDPDKYSGYGPKDIVYDSLRADSRRGEAVYMTHCKTCHQEDGQGLWNADKTTYVNPPLWGPNSYQEGSSMHRVIKAARFIKYNMPNKQATLDEPVLTDQEALDVAAFINDGSIHPRPKSKYVCYPNKDTKPIDYFKGPYLDGFSEDQHTFGPWREIEQFYRKQGLVAHK